MSHEMSSKHMMHAMQADALLASADATHVARRSGDWSDPDTWEGGRVPGAEAKVHIPEDLEIVYDVESDTPLHTVRVDGILTWARQQDTTMVVETIVSTHGSQIEIGSMHNSPIAADHTANIVFRDTPIDTAADPEQLGHGLVAFGHVDIQGAEKESFLALEGGARAGDRSIKVDGDLTNWEIGDTILLVGTGGGSRDEERTITGIDGDTITFDQALNHDHRPPSGFDFDTFVGNLSRNVTFSSENPNGVRGHVMLMNDVVDHGQNANSVLFAAFDELGRTESARVTGTDDNPLGRYPLHLHEIGTGVDAPVSMIEGNAISGSPGWGITHHSSHAMINHNIVYDTRGSGIVSEDGDETGMWIGNLVTTVAAGDVEGGTDQPGAEGAAYENQSRVVFQQDNIAANAKIGWNWFGREDFPEDGGGDRSGAPKDGVHREMFTREQVPYDPSPFDVALDHEEPPIIDFNDNTAIGTEIGLRVFHRQFSDDTDTMSVFRDFDVWGGTDAVQLENYASNYQFIDSTWQGDGVGFRIERKTSSAVFDNVDMHGFDTGYQSFGVNHESVLMDTTFSNVDEHFELKDLLRSVSDSGTRNSLIDYYRAEHGIDYENPMPRIVDSSDFTPIEAVTFSPDPGSDLTIGPGDNRLQFTGTITDSLGDRNFNEYVIAKPPNGRGTSKDFEGIDIYLGATTGDGFQKEFTLEEFLELHGAFQKADGSWVSPVVNWITDRLTGDQHPVIIEIRLEGFREGELEQYELDEYPDPGINNLGWYEANLPDGRPTGGGSTGDGSTGDGSTGDGSTGDGSTGDGSTGDGSTGDGSTGDGSTGDGSTGDGSTGDGSTGDGSTGDSSTGDGSTGDGSTGDG